MRLKIIKDQIVKILSNGTSAIDELNDMQEYFRHYGEIKFSLKKGERQIIAVSTNYRHGAIITAGRNQKELDENIKDAILTMFEIPSVYAKEAGIHKVGEKEASYAPA